jgi:molecular chaperone GrpE
MTDETQKTPVEASGPGAMPGAEEPSADAQVAAAEQPLPEPADAEPAEAPAEDEAAKYLALAQRTQADFENFRKRAARDKAEAADRGMGRLAKELLPALDHLELALRATEEHEGAEDVVKGFRLVHEELLGALERVGIQGFSPHGEPFDPNEHEAMAQQPAENAAPGTVIEVYQRGYRLNGQVLRPARVVVAG